MKTCMKNWGMVIALCLSMGISACNPQTTSAPSEMFANKGVSANDTAVANVNGTTIYLSDVKRASVAQGIIKDEADLNPSDPAFKAVLEELIDQRLLALDALSKSIDQEAETQQRLRSAQERLLGNIRIEKQLKTQVNEAAVRRMYEEQVKLSARGEERKVRHILVADKAAAQSIYNALQEGGNFAALAKQKSIDNGTAKTGGDLGYFSRDMLDTAFSSAVFKAKIGDRIPPFKTQYGWHVAEVMDSRIPPTPKFEDMRPEIVSFMTFDAIQSLLKDLRAENEVTVLANVTPDPVPDIEPITPEENLPDD